MDFDPNVYFNFWGFFLMEIMNIRMLENIGLIIKAYNPAPDMAAKIAMIPPMH